MTQTTQKIRAPIPSKLKWVFGGKPRYRGAYGGRGSGKSVGFARMAILGAMQSKIRFLGAREVQATIRDSVLQELVEQVQELGLDQFFDAGDKHLRCTLTGSEFIFKGLRRNYKEIKSTTSIDICWVEEAEAVSEPSWRTLIPTIRKTGSEIWLTWNPELEDSATHRRFILHPPYSARIARLNWNDNPWFPPELEQERQRDMELDPDLYSHIWEGEPRRSVQAQVLGGKWVVDSFEPGEDWGGPYYGLDFGFGIDPTAGVRIWIHERKLFVEYEAGKVGLELDHTADFLKERIPGIEYHNCWADSSRPESISYLKRHGMPRLKDAPKWAGSVHEGITFMRNFDRIVVHPRCKEFQTECKYYCHKVDIYTAEVRPEIVKAYDHYIDATRYALSPLIRRKTKPGVRKL